MSKVHPNGVTRHGVRNLTTAGLVAVVGAIVLGILGMHGLSQHGAMPGHGDHQPVATAANADPHAGHAAMTHADTATVISDPATTVTVAAGGTGGSVGQLAMLCAVMLVAAAAGVLLVLRLRRFAPSAPLNLRARLLAVRTLVRDRLDTGPPGVWELSVVRC